MFRAIGHFLTNPLYVLVLLMLVALVLYWYNHLKAFKRVAILVGAGFVLSITSPLPNFLAASLEKHYRPFQITQHPDLGEEPHIVVLGAGFTNDTTLQPTQQLSKTGLGRLVEGYRIYRRTANATMVTSGPKYNGRNAMGKMVAEAALQLGVDPQDTIQLNRPYNTASEARYYAQRFPEKDEIILVTNALHMKRAMYWFQHYGKSPIPAPTNYEVKTDAFEKHSFIGISPNYMETLGKALHEYAGLYYAYWLTW